MRHEMQHGKKLAVVFGGEGFGLSAAAVDQADGHFLIPMVGVSQSLNLSVSVATTLYALRGDDLAADLPGGMSHKSRKRITMLGCEHKKAKPSTKPWRPGRQKKGHDRKGEVLG